MRRFKQENDTVICFLFFFYFVSLSSPLCQSQTFLFFYNNPFLCLYFSPSAFSSLRLYFLLSFISFLFLVSPPIKIWLRRELRRSPNSPRVLLRRVREQAEAPSSLSPLFSPVLYDGSSDCRRGRRVILVRVRGLFRFRISHASFRRPFVSFVLFFLLLLYLAPFSPSSRSIEVTFITEHMVARTSGTCFGLSHEIANSRESLPIISSTLKSDEMTI